MVSRRRLAAFEPSAKRLSGKLITLQVRMVDRYVPDRLLLILVNTLDKHVAPRAINRVIDGLERIPPRMRSTLISAADSYVPDTVASSRKVSAVIANVGKYVPNRVIPPESAEEWSKVKGKFHIPILLSRSTE